MQQDVTTSTKTSYSDLSDFLHCRKLWDYRSSSRKNLEPKAVQWDFWFGTGIHEALAAYYRDMAYTHPASAFEHWCGEEYDRFASLGLLTDDIRAKVDDLHTLGIGMLHHYMQWAPIHDTFTVLAVEHPFSIDLPSITKTGVIDAVVADDYGDVWLMEHKTRDYFSDERALALDRQTSFYQWVAQVLVRRGEFLDLPTTTNVRGVIFTELKKALPKRPDLLKSGAAVSRNMNISTTYDIYLAEIARYGFNPDDYAKELGILERQANPFFRRIWYPRTTAELKMFERDMLMQIADMTRPDVAIYRNPSKMCPKYCAFFDACRTHYEGGDEAYILNTHYQQRTVHHTKVHQNL